MNQISSLFSDPEVNCNSRGIKSFHIQKLSHCACSKHKSIWTNSRTNCRTGSDCSREQSDQTLYTFSIGHPARHIFTVWQNKWNFQKLKILSHLYGNILDLWMHSVNFLYLACTLDVILRASNTIFLHFYYA